MTEKITISGRVTKETEARFEEYRESRDLSKSDALRQLLDAGLDSLEENITESKASSWSPLEARILNLLETSFALWLVSGAVGLAVVLSVVLLSVQGIAEDIFVLVFGICVTIFLLTTVLSALSLTVLFFGLAPDIGKFIEGKLTHE